MINDDTIQSMEKYFRIVKDSAKSLRAKSIDAEITKDNIALANEMKDYLIASQNEKIAQKYHLREGVGLAAPQIGKNIKVIAVYYEDEDEKGNKKIVDHRLINPKIILESLKLAYLEAGEGCLSVDAKHEGYVYRHYKIQVKAYDVALAKETIITAYGFEAIVLQHEIDHLNGVLYYDYINKTNPFEFKDNAVRL